MFRKKINIEFEVDTSSESEMNLPFLVGTSLHLDKKKELNRNLNRTLQDFGPSILSNEEDVLHLRKK